MVLKDSAAAGKVAQQHADRYDATIDHVYRAALKGYSAMMSPAAAARLADDDRVLFVQRDGVAQASAQSTPTPASTSTTPT